MTTLESDMGETTAAKAVRVEHDLLGDVEIPADAYWGAHSQRASDGVAPGAASIGAYPLLTDAIVLVKKAACAANTKLGVIEPQHGAAITQACDEVLGGALLDQLIVDVLAPSDTSYNMNVNEVLANRASEILGSPLGAYSPIHPNDHVNRSQSTNDVIHTALHLLAVHLVERLSVALEELEQSFLRKAAEHADFVKMGRTCLQDALPISFGQIWTGYASAVRGCREALRRELEPLEVVNLGATAIGTGFATPPGYQSMVVELLSEVTGRTWREPESLVGATQNDEPMAFLMSRARVTGISMSKIATDLKLMGSGPVAGLNEIRLPAVQSGSSIMPGKVNPVVPMLVNQTAYLVAGYDDAVSLAVSDGELELNSHGSMVAYCMLESFRLLERAARTLATMCVDGIEVNVETCAQMTARSPVLATALLPVTGYDAASKVAYAALDQGRPVVDVVTDMGIVDRETAQALLDPRNFLAPAER
ncbi:MAG: aspartate ammonia-lyase [Solirubrobacteraceae bacterium]|nr:aspartate ammonia-lyase [Solirubrobacteraceae bacterium]